MLIHLAGVIIGWSGAALFALFGFTHQDVTAIIVAIITAGGLILSTRNQRRITRLERAIEKKRVVAVRHSKGQTGPTGTLYDEDETDD